MRAKDDTFRTYWWYVFACSWSSWSTLWWCVLKRSYLFICFICFFWHKEVWCKSKIQYFTYSTLFIETRPLARRQTARNVMDCMHLFAHCNGLTRRDARVSVSRASLYLVGIILLPHWGVFCSIQNTSFVLVWCNLSMKPWNFLNRPQIWRNQPKDGIFD